MSKSLTNTPLNCLQRSCELCRRRIRHCPKSKRPLRDTLAQQVLASSREGDCYIRDGHPLGEEKRVRWSSLCYSVHLGLSPVKFCMKMIHFQLQIKPTE